MAGEGFFERGQGAERESEGERRVIGLAIPLVRLATLALGRSVVANYFFIDGVVGRGEVAAGAEFEERGCGNS